MPLALPCGQRCCSSWGLGKGFGLWFTCPGPLHPGTMLCWVQLRALECFEVRQPGICKPDLALGQVSGQPV